MLAVDTVSTVETTLPEVDTALTGWKPRVFGYGRDIGNKIINVAKDNPLQTGLAVAEAGDLLVHELKPGSTFQSSVDGTIEDAGKLAGKVAGTVTSGAIGGVEDLIQDNPASLIGIALFTLYLIKK